MENCERPRRPRHRARPVWRHLSHFGLPVRADQSYRDGRIRRTQRIELSGLKQLSLDELTPTTHSANRPVPLLEGSSLLGRYVDDNTEEKTIGKGASFIQQYRSDDADSEEEDCPFDDPFLEDGFGNLTKWRLSDLKKDFIRHLEDESNRPRTQERKHSKEEKMKLHNDLMEQYMKSALKKYNTEENLDEDLGSEFVKAIKESFIVEGAVNFYRHFNFTAMQGSTFHLFFAEVIRDGESCDVSCCRLLHDNDNGRCLGCKNQGDPDLRHPASDNVYAGGHQDCTFPFLIDSDSEDDSD